MKAFMSSSIQAPDFLQQKGTCKSILAQVDKAHTGERPSSNAHIGGRDVLSGLKNANGSTKDLNASPGPEGSL